MLARAHKEGFCIAKSGIALRPSRTPPDTCGMHMPHALSVVVTWVSLAHRLRESNYANDVGSTLVRITYADGLANVKALASCFHAPPCR